MRVLVELLCREPVKNVLAPCAFNPETVVYLCGTRDATFFRESAVCRLFSRRRLRCRPRFYYFDAGDPAGIRRVIDAVVRDYPGCVFDFTGGNDLVLMLAGTRFAELRLPGFYIVMPGGVFLNLRGCEEEARVFALPAFEAGDVFAMTGAAVKGQGHFPEAQMDAAFERDALAVWEAVRENPREFGVLVSWLQAAAGGGLAGTLDFDAPRKIPGRRGASPSPALLRRLGAIGVFTRLELDRTRIRFSFKNALYRKCLLIEGLWLELYCYLTAKRGGFFDDVRTSVVVDWDGEAGGADGTRNEVDVLLVKGVTPVFVSCKMSLPTALAMSEVRLLATRFGGALARAVILTAASLSGESRALRQRAAELDITVLGREAMEDGGLQKALEAAAGAAR